MTLAVNDAGDVLSDASGDWKPALKALNDKTGQSLVLDGSSWKPFPGGQSAAPTDSPNATTPTMSEYGPSYAAPAPSDAAPGDAAVERVGKAAGNAFTGTQTILTPYAEDLVNKGGPIGRYITNPAIHAVDVAHGAINAGMAGLTQTAMELFGEKGGRDLLAFASSLPMAPEAQQLTAMRANSPAALAEVPAAATPDAAPAAAQPPPNSVPFAELDTRNKIARVLQDQINQDAIPRGTANQGSEAIEAIASAPDINTAIQAAGKAVEAPARPIAEWMQPLSRLPVDPRLAEDIMTPPGSLPPGYAEPASTRRQITAGQVQARDRVGYNEAVRRAAAENAQASAPVDESALMGDVLPPEGAAPQSMADYLKANATGATPAEAPVPQSVGAAASREGTAPDLILPETPAQRATSLQKMVNQSAEDRVMPSGRDDAVYVPGVERPEAMRDFSPAPEGQESSALAHKTLYNTDSNYHDQFDAQVKKNNDVMVDRLGNLMGDANSRDAAMNAAKELMPGPVGLFDNQKPVSAQPIADRINEILAGPAGKRGAVRTQLSNILDNLKDTNGNLEEMPSMLKGIRDDITDKLYDKSPTTEGNAARTARNQLQDVLAVVDDTIAKGLPGTKYQDYLANLSAALGAVAKQDYLQSFLTGQKKLTDLAGNLVFRKVQNLLEDIQKRHADRTGGAKELTMDEINQIEAVRNELAAKDLLDRRAAVRGSPTAQLTNAAGVLGSGPLGTGIKSAAEVALHAGLVPLTGGVGNAALLGYRHIFKPAMEAARAQKAAEALAATKQRLLDTAPRLDEAP